MIRSECADKAADTNLTQDQGRHLRRRRRGHAWRKLIAPQGPRRLCRGLRSASGGAAEHTHSSRFAFRRRDEAGRPPRATTPALPAPTGAPTARGQVREFGDDCGAGIVDRHACGTVWAQPPAMPASGRSDAPALNSICSRSNPRPWPQFERTRSTHPTPCRAPRSPSAGSVASHKPHEPPPGTRAPAKFGAHAPADQAARRVTELSWRERAASTSQSIRHLACSTRAGLSIREWLAGNRLDFGVVLQTECKRLHPAGPNRLVDRTLQRNRSGRLAGSPHEQRCAGVDPDRLVRHGDGRARVKRMRASAAGSKKSSKLLDTVFA